MWLRCDTCRRYGRLRLAGPHDVDYPRLVAAAPRAARCPPVRAQHRRRPWLHDWHFGTEVLPRATTAGPGSAAVGDCAGRCTTTRQCRGKSRNQNDHRPEGKVCHGAGMRPLHAGFNGSDFTSSATTASISFRCAANRPGWLAALGAEVDQLARHPLPVSSRRTLASVVPLA
jgi:hypothetical protein